MDDSTKLRCELLRDIRLPKSQAWLADRLKVSKTQVHRWESGLNRIKWDSFVKICQVRKLKVNDAINSVTFENPTQEIRPAAIIRHLAAGLKVGEIAKRLICSRFTVSRWLNAKSEPDLDDVLAAFLTMKPMLLRPFLTPIVSMEFEKKHHSLLINPKIEVDLTYEYPIVALVLRSLELKKYIDCESHPTGFVSKVAGISIQEEKHLLSLLETAGLLSFDGRKYNVINTQVDMRGDLKGILRVRKFWLERAIRHIDHPEDAAPIGLFKSNVFSVSPPAYERVQKLYLDFFEEVRGIVDRDKASPEIVAVLSMNLFDPSRPH